MFTLQPGDAEFALRWRCIKTIFTRTVIAGGVSFTPSDGGGHTLWQRRFWKHTVRDATDFARPVDYIHFNPVKHGYVEEPGNWPYSFLHRYVRRRILPSNWGNAAGDDGSGEFGERSEPHT